MTLDEAIQRVISDMEGTLSLSDFFREVAKHVYVSQPQEVSDRLLALLVDEKIAVSLTVKRGAVLAVNLPHTA